MVANFVCLTQLTFSAIIIQLYSEGMVYSNVNMRNSDPSVISATNKPISIFRANVNGRLGQCLLAKTGFIYTPVCG